jgi:N-acetyltransferase
MSDSLRLTGRHVRLEPLGHAHVEGLLAAALQQPSLYDWSPVPQTRAAMEQYVDAALAMVSAGTAAAFATVRIGDGVVVGSTRFFDLVRWAWPEGHALHGRTTPDVCEIGYTWLGQDAIRTPVNTESKLLMLQHAFETWGVHGVCLHTDVRNKRSRAAIERIGGRLDGVLRAYRLAIDLTPRNSARYSITAAEWPAVKARLLERLAAS